LKLQVLPLKLKKKNGYLLFETADEEFGDEKTVDLLRKRIADTISIHKQSASVDRAIEMNEKYLQQILQTDRRGGMSHQNFEHLEDMLIESRDFL